MDGKLVSNVVSCLGLLLIHASLINSASAEVTFLNTWNGYDSDHFSFPNGVAVSGTGQVYVADTGNHRIQRVFDSDAWFSGTNTFVDDIVGPTSISVGPGDILGSSVNLDSSKGLVVGNTTTVNSGGSLVINGGKLKTSILLLDGGAGTFDWPYLSDINTVQFNSGTLKLTGSAGLAIDAAGPNRFEFAMNSQ